VQIRWDEEANLPVLHTVWVKTYTGLETVTSDVSEIDTKSKELHDLLIQILEAVGAIQGGESQA
jgi:hypothetical protein